MVLLTERLFSWVSVYVSRIGETVCSRQVHPFGFDSQLPFFFKVSFISSHPGKWLGDHLGLVLGSAGVKRGFFDHGIWKESMGLQRCPSPLYPARLTMCSGFATKLSHPPCPTSCCPQPDLSWGSLWRSAYQSPNPRSLRVFTGTQVGAAQTEYPGGPESKRKKGRIRGGGERKH